MLEFFLYNKLLVGTGKQMAAVENGIKDVFPLAWLKMYFVSELSQSTTGLTYVDPGIFVNSDTCNFTVPEALKDKKQELLDNLRTVLEKYQQTKLKVLFFLLTSLRRVPQNLDKKFQLQCTVEGADPSQEPEMGFRSSVWGWDIPQKLLENPSDLKKAIDTQILAVDEDFAK